MLDRRSVLAMLAAGVTLPLLPRPARAAGLTTIRVAGAADDDITPIVYGNVAGIFKKHGLDVQLSTLASGSATASAVAGGSVDIGKSSMMSLISAHVRGIPFKIVSSAALYLESAPIAGLIVAKDSPIKTGRDFAGKTVSASSLKDLIAVATQSWIDQNGGDSSKVNFIELPSSAASVAMQQRKIDGATLVTPALAEALDSGTTRLIGRSFSAIAKRFLVAGWFCTDDYLSKNGDAVARFADAFREASNYTNTHHEQTVSLLAEFSHLKVDTIKRMVRSTASAAVEARDIDPVIAAAVKYKVIDKGFPGAELVALVPGRK